MLDYCVIGAKFKVLGNFILLGGTIALRMFIGVGYIQECTNTIIFGCYPVYKSSLMLIPLRIVYRFYPPKMIGNCVDADREIHRIPVEEIQSLCQRQVQLMSRFVH